MRHREAHTETREVEVVIAEWKTCDLCGARISRSDVFDVEEITVMHREGVRYPEGGRHSETSADLCSDCFTGKLIPWLAEQGVQMLEEEKGW